MSVGLFTFSQDSENMVENPSFEAIEGKIKRNGAISVAVGWMSPTKTAADLYSSKVKDGFGTPDNTYGTEAPYDGGNYAGIRTFSYNDKEPRQYVSAKLKLPLRKDAMYCVKFYVSMAEGSKYAANNIGANFSKKQYNIDEDKHILVPTTIQHRDNPVFNAVFGWDEICGTFIAEGGEKFITLGNFYSNAETKNQRLKKMKTFTGTSVMSAYYYIDNVSVIMIDDQSECDCKVKELEVKTTYVYEVGAVNPEGMSSDLIVKYTELYFGYGTSEFTKGDLEHLANIEKVMKASETDKLTILGHVDSDEAEDEDLIGLDKERAQAVKDHLVAKGIDASRITVVGKADLSPENSLGDEIGQAKNRRVIFKLN